jgi:hypothetical protein
MNAGDGMGPGGRKKLQRPSWDHAPAAAVQWVRRSRRLTTAARLVTTALGIVLQRVVTAFPACLSILRGRLFRVGDWLVMGWCAGMSSHSASFSQAALYP